MTQSPYNGVFGNPLDEQGAYWLGFIWADGSIGRYGRQRRVAVGLKESDGPHLRELASFLGYPADTVKLRSGAAFFQVNSVDLFKDLRDWGIHPNKSDSIDDIHCVDGLMSHFLRGLFDGDGSVGAYEIKGRNYKRPRFSFCGRELAVTMMKYELEHRLGIELGGVRQDTSNGSYQVATAARDNVAAIFDFFYSTGGPFLSRKKERFETAANLERPEPRRQYEKYDDNGHGAVETTCAYCDKTFWKRADRVTESGNDYCSRQCSGRANYKKANEARWST